MARDALPGPGGHPLLGVFLAVRRDPLGFLLESARRYGDVVSMRLGLRRFHLLSHPAHVKQVLQDKHGTYAKSAPAAPVGPVFGQSLTTLDGDQWRRQRRRMQPAFDPKRLLTAVPVVTEATAHMLDRWQRTAERGETIDGMREMWAVSRAIILRMLFGNVMPAEARVVEEALDVVLAHVDRRLWNPLGVFGVSTPVGRRFRNALRTVHRFLSGMIERAHHRLIPPEAVLSQMLDVRDTETGERMTDSELRNELKALLVAGHTTTASALAWACYVLSTQPLAGEQLEREVRQTPGGRCPSVDDLARLPYARMLVSEVLRLYPPTWVTARALLRDEEIGGRHLPAGDTVLLSPYVTQRHPDFWEDPDRFDPERFTVARSAGRPSFAYFPFGGGPRSCIGSGLASVEMQLVVVMVAQRFRLSIPPGRAVDIDPGLTLRPRPGVPLVLQPVDVRFRSASGTVPV
jgi:cytochrome P450